MKKCISLFALVLLLALAVGALVSCDTDSRTVIPFVGGSGSAGDATPYVTDVKVESGNIIVCYSDGSCVNIGSSVTNVTENHIGNVTIEGTGGSTASFAASRAMLSTVQVVCQFTKTVEYWSFGRYYSQDQSYSSAGSGVIYMLDKTTGDALIITNQHVVYDSDSKTSNHVSDNISIYLCGGTEAIPATYVGGTPDYDIAVLRVKNSGVLKSSAAQAATAADSSALAVGSTALVVGNPEGAGISTTAGIVSVDSETIRMTAIDNEKKSNDFRVIRVDAAVNSGNSGGGLYNEKGELIGIVNAKIVSSSIENIGYAIPSNVAVAVAENIIANGGTFCRAVLNVTVNSVDPHMVYDANTFLTSVAETVVVDTVNAGAGKLIGLTSGDTVLSVKIGDREAVNVTRSFHVIDEMLNARIGDVVTVTVLRSGKQVVLTGTVDSTWIE